MSADLHAIWLDDLAPGEGTNPIWDALYAEQDDETQRVVFNACADEHTEPVAVEVEYDPMPEVAALLVPDLDEAVAHIENEIAKFASRPKPRKKPAKKATRKPKSPLASQEARLRTVKGRMADEFKTPGGGAS